jgi:phosphatidylglycerophosphate synthase
MMSTQTANAQDRIEGAIDLQLIQTMYRKLGLPVATSLEKYTSITPNQITFVSFFIGCISGGLFATGNYRCTVIASFLLLISIILNFVDGDLARRLGRKSGLGHWLNIALERCTDFFLIAGIAVGVGLNGLVIESYIAAVLFAASRFVIDATYFAAYLVAPYLKENYQSIQQRQTIASVIFRQCVYTRVSVLTLVVPFALLDCLIYYLYLMAIYGIVWYVGTLIYISKKIYHHEMAAVENG